MGDRRAEDPGGVPPELPRRHVSERSVDEISENSFDDRVRTVCDICVDGASGGVGEKWMISPDRKQRVQKSCVFNSADDQPSGDRGLAGSGSGVTDRFRMSSAWQMAYCLRFRQGAPSVC